MTPKIRQKPSDAEQVRIDDGFPELADLAFLLDSRWRVPVLGIRFGMDAVAGLIPVVGDLAAASISGYILVKAHRLGAPRMLLMQMAGNVAVDTLVGAIPIAGTVFDVFFKANNVNIRLLREHLADRGKRLPVALIGQETAADQPEPPQRQR
jgi:hypothetical protein